jgi:glycosyltransferase involved in cell wall biosynthesis
MRVVIDATRLGSGAGGDETMMSGLLKGLALTATAEDEFLVVVNQGVELPQAVQRSAAMREIRVRRLPGIVHFGVRLPWVVARQRPQPDLVFSPIHAPMSQRVPRALMVQDLSFEHHPEFFPAKVRVRLQSVVRRQARRVRSVLTISDDARKDLISTYGLDPKIVTEIPLYALDPVEPTAGEAEAARDWLKSQGLMGPYFLYLGNLHPRKNLARAIEAFGLLQQRRPDLADHQLVIAGGRWWGSGEGDTAAQRAAAGSVVMVGKVDELQREVLMRDALALVYVSLFEGFGLPPLEAMLRGTRVIASNVTSIPEVVGGGGLLVDPLDPDAISEAMIRVATDPELRATLVEAGLARAGQYNELATGTAFYDALSAAVALD